MKPLTSERNFTPSSTALLSAADATAGVVVEAQIVHGHPGGGGGGVAAVVKDHETFDAKALPARSLTRGSVVPPRTVAV
jgi:hypothetical protein